MTGPDRQLDAQRSELRAEPSAGAISRDDLLLGLAAAVPALVLYLFTLSPGVTGEDSGELIAAADLLGIAHPPGYPIWCLLAKLTSLLVPVGNVAWRINLFSALVGAATVFFVTMITRRLGGGRTASVMAGWLAAISLDFWSQAVIAEVYTLNALFLVIGLWIVLHYGETRRRRGLYAFALLWGLSLTNHQIMGPAGLLMAIYLVWLNRRAPVRWKTLGCAVALFAVGLLPLLYLPIRSRADTIMDWGNPETLSAFIDHVTRAQYQFKTHEVARSFGLFVGQVGVVAGYAWSQWSFPCLLALAGVRVAWRAGRERAVLLAVLIGTMTVGLTWFLNFRLEQEEIVTSRAFYAAAWPLAAILIGLGLRWPKALTARAGALCRRLGLPVLAALVAFPLLRNLPRDDRHADHLPHDFGLALLETLDRDAILFPSSDHTTFPILYLQAVEGRRLDVTVANKYGAVEPGLLADMPDRLRKAVLEHRDERAKEEWIVKREFGKRPIYFSQKRSFPALPELMLAPVGLLYRVVARDHMDELARRQETIWDAYRLRGLETPLARLDYSGTVILSDYHFARARYLFAADRKEAAEEELARAADYAGDLKQTLNNIGSLLAEHGEAAKAEPHFRRAIEIDPDYAMAIRNLCQVLTSMGRRAETADLFRHLTEMNPRDAGARVALARALNARGDLKDALDAYLTARVIRPTDAGLAREVGTFLVYRLHDLERGREVLQESLELNPKQADLRRMLADLERQEQGDLPGDLPGEMPNPFADIPLPPGMEMPFPEMPQPPLPKVPLPEIPDPTKGPPRAGGLSGAGRRTRR